VLINQCLTSAAVCLRRGCQSKVAGHVCHIAYQCNGSCAITRTWHLTLQTAICSRFVKSNLAHLHLLFVLLLLLFRAQAPSTRQQQRTWDVVSGCRTHAHSVVQTALQLVHDCNIGLNNTSQRHERHNTITVQHSKRSRRASCLLLCVCRLLHWIDLTDAHHCVPR
jgi:hypothetical protein